MEKVYTSSIWTDDNYFVFNFFYTSSVIDMTIQYNPTGIDESKIQDKLRELKIVYIHKGCPFNKNINFNMTGYSDDEQSEGLKGWIKFIPNSKTIGVDSNFYYGATTNPIEFEGFLAILPLDESKKKSLFEHFSDFFKKVGKAFNDLLTGIFSKAN